MARIALLGSPFLFALVLFAAGLFPAAACAQARSPADSPASIPAGAIPAAAPAPKHRSKTPSDRVSAKDAAEADNAYLEGAKQVEHNDLAAAEHSFERATHLNPTDQEYALALIVTRENYVTQLVQRAAQAHALGDAQKADSLLAQAHTLDPDNRSVAQHFRTDDPAPAASAVKTAYNPGLFYGSIDPMKFPAKDIASTLSGPVELTPLPGKKNVHLHGDPQTVIRNLYGLYGIKVSFDRSVGGPSLSLDMNNVSFTGARRALDIAADVFAVPLQPKYVMVAKDTPENRKQLMPQVEETIYLPGHSNDEMQQLANVARNIFDIKEVTASSTGGFILLRGDPDVLRQVNALYDDMLNGGSEVLFDVKLYELDKDVENNVGATLPSSAGIFSIASEAQSLVSTNESLINQAVAAGLLTLNGSPLQNLITEVGFLVASGTVTASQYTNLLGVFGGGLTFGGLYLGSSSTFNLALTSTDVRMLDDVQVRASDHQTGTFREGERYPVVTATYSSGVSSTLASSLSGLNVNGTSVSSLLSQYLGTSTATVPQFQYEDLGITLKLKPEVLSHDDVSVALDEKVEALAGSSINNIPILTNRALTSTVTIPAGQTAMLVSLVNTEEIKALTGIPGLSELPGFQGTDQDRTKDSTEILITITPHIVRNGRLKIASRALAAIRTGNGSGGGSDTGMEPGSDMERRRDEGGMGRRLKDEPRQ